MTLSELAYRLNLTERETVVLRLLSAGFDIEKIAYFLRISPNAVKRYLIMMRNRTAKTGYTLL